MDKIDHQLEIEIKLKLGSFPDYLKMVGFLGNPDAEEHQVNAFFDSEDTLLLQAGWGLRVRADNDRGLVTLKRTTGEDQAMAIVRQELESEIPRGVAREIIDLHAEVDSLDCAPLEIVQEKFPDIQLRRIARFENKRLRKQHRIGDYQYTLELDRTEYPDGSSDYELEMELERAEQIDVVTNSLKRLFESLNIPFEHQGLTKLERALERTVRH